MGMDAKFKLERVVEGGIARYPRTSPKDEELSYEDPRDVPIAALPPGRVSVDESYSFGKLLRDLAGEMACVSPDFPIQFLEVMRNLAMVNPDVAQAKENLVQLGNTGHTVLVEGMNAGAEAALLDAVMNFQARAFHRFGGVDGFINSCIGQIAVGGAISVEWVVAEDFSGIDRVVSVPIHEIRFSYDREKQAYLPFQKVESEDFQRQRVYLNPYTYQYCPLQTLDNSPYAIPPILSAMESIMIQRDMVKNIRFMVRKMGLLGFVSVLVKQPQKQNAESETAYLNRCLTTLEAHAERMRHNYRDGLAFGFQDTFTINHNQIPNPGGAKELFELNEQMLFSGLKADPALHGRTYSTTETYAGVVYEKMLSMITNYQRVVRQVLEYGYKLHFILSGLRYSSVTVEFNPSKSLSSERDENTYQVKLANLTTLFEQGIIDQDQFAQEAGYENAALPGPRFEQGLVEDPAANDPANQDTPQEGEGGDNTNNDSEDDTQDSNQTVRLTFNRKTGCYEMKKKKPVKRPSYKLNPEREYDQADEEEEESLDDAYERCEREIAHHDTCCAHGHSFAADTPAARKAKRFAASYFKAVYPEVRWARNQGLKEVNDFLDDFDFNTGDSDQFSNGVIATLAATFGAAIKQTKLVAKVRTNLNTIYRFFRLQDKTPFGGEFPIKPSFNLVDEQAVKFLREADDFYFGRYITDPQTKKSLKNWLSEEYLQKGRSIQEPDVLASFKEAFKGKVQLQDHKILQVVETSTSRARNWGNIFTMEEAKAQTIEIRGPRDNLTCKWCKEMIGKIFKVPQVTTHVKNVMGRPPEDLPKLNPFIPGRLSPETVGIKNNEDFLLAQGIALPPYHPRCRGSYIVKDFEEF